MKLDRRIIEGKRPLSCFDVEEAKQFIGKEGYFANCLRVFKTIEYFEKWTLTNVDEKEEQGFRDAIGGNYWNYFLPAEWVKEKEPEPVWKPYDLDAWRNDGFMIGSIITFRYAAIPYDNVPIYTVVFLGTRECSADLNQTAILLGSEWYDFQKLFNEYEIFDNKYSDDNLCRWRPFGYQE